jgi:hypothetical protein
MVRSGSGSMAAWRLTTKVDHNGIRIRPIRAGRGVAVVQVSDDKRQRGCTLQARGHWFEPTCAHPGLQLTQLRRIVTRLSSCGSMFLKKWCLRNPGGSRRLCLHKLRLRRIASRSGRTYLRLSGRAFSGG